jgi:hypothetical protein
VITPTTAASTEASLATTVLSTKAAMATADAGARAGAGVTPSLGGSSSQGCKSKDELCVHLDG